MKSLITSIAILGVFSLAIGVAGNAAETTVSATVTVQNISVSVSDGIVAYGTLGAGDSEDTTSSGVDNTQIAANDGNITEDFNIRGTDSDDWLLKAVPAATNEYKHEFCKVDTGDCDGTPDWTALTTSNQTLKLGVTESGTYDFDLQITTPDPSTSYVQQSVNVTVVATATL